MREEVKLRLFMAGLVTFGSINMITYQLQNQTYYID